MTETFVFTAAGKPREAFRIDGGDGGRLLLFPDWRGAFATGAADLATAYAATARVETILVDPWGLGVRPTAFADVAADVEALAADPIATRTDLAAVFAALEPHWRRPSRPAIAAGFCLGGTLAFELGRTGVALDAVVAIHGAPNTGRPATAATRPAHLPRFVLAHGDADPFVVDEAVDRFMEEMREIAAPWSAHRIGGAVHSFTRADLVPALPGQAFDRTAEVELRRLVAALFEIAHELAETPARPLAPGLADRPASSDG